MKQLVAAGVAIAMVSTGGIAVTRSSSVKITDSFVVEETCTLNTTRVSDNDMYGDAQHKLKVTSNILNATKSLKFSDITAPQIDNPTIFKLGEPLNSLAGKTIPVTNFVDIKFGGTIKKGTNSGNYDASVTVTAVCQ